MIRKYAIMFCDVLSFAAIPALVALMMYAAAGGLGEEERSPASKVGAQIVVTERSVEQFTAPLDNYYTRRKARGK